MLWQGIEDSAADLKQNLFQHIVNGTQTLFDEAHENLEHLAKPKATAMLMPTTPVLSPTTIPSTPNTHPRGHPAANY